MVFISAEKSVYGRCFASGFVVVCFRGVRKFGDNAEWSVDVLESADKMNGMTMVETLAAVPWVACSGNAVFGRANHRSQITNCSEMMLDFAVPSRNHAQVTGLRDCHQDRHDKGPIIIRPK